MTSRHLSYGAGVIFTVAGAACWSLGGALVRATDGIDAWQIIFYRSSTVLALMGAWLTYRLRGHLLSHMARAGINAVVAGMAVGTAGLTFVASLFYTTVAQAIFMVGMAPFLSAIIGYWILRERIPGVTWISMMIALFGMTIIFGGSGGSGGFIGTMLAIYSAFCFSCYAVLLRWGQNTEMSVALIWNALFLIAVSAIVLLAPTGLRPVHGIGQLAVGWWNFLWILVMGAVQLTLGLILFTIGSRSVPAAQLSLFALVEPVLAPLWAWLVARELPPIWTFVGGAVILIAIVMQALMSAARELRHVGSRR